MRQKRSEHPPISGGVSESGVRTATDVQRVGDAEERERNREEGGRPGGYRSYEAQRARDAGLRSPRPFANPLESLQSAPQPSGLAFDAPSVPDAGLVTEVPPSATALLNSPEPFRVMEPLRRKSEPPDAADSVVIRRGQRLEQKARHAERLLQQLPENDRRRRLLHAAIVRRDEVLLDGFIAELGG